MSFFAGLLTFVLIINCVLLILLVLVQLPKKDAGAGLAFGGGAADALFGAGSGNVLTKITKYATIAFLAISLILGIIENNLYNGRNNMSDFEKRVAAQQQAQPSMTAPPASQPVAKPAVSTATNNSPSLLLTPSTIPSSPVVPAPAK
jgi:preprotein translocase subunit SecG